MSGVWELSVDLSRFIYNLYGFNLKDTLKLDENTTSELNSIKSFFSSYIRAVTDFISNETTTQAEIELKILELGCGHALPSLAALKLVEDNVRSLTQNLIKTNPHMSDYDTSQHAKYTFSLNMLVYLQDFNEQILENVTFENVKKYLINSSDEYLFSLNRVNYRIRLNKTFVFVYGDWNDMFRKRLLPSNYFDLILTSETIYNSSNYKCLLNLFRECLNASGAESKSPPLEIIDIDSENNETGIKKLKSSTKSGCVYPSFVLLSAKSYYFGCGGNLYEFIKLLKSNVYKLNASSNLLIESIISNNDLKLSQLDSNYHVNSNYDDEQLKTEKHINNTLEINLNSEINTTNNSTNLNSVDDDFNIYSNISKEIIRVYI